MKHSLPSLVLAAALLVAAPFAHATLIHFHFNLSGANEVPATPSLGTGVVDLDLDTTAQTLAGNIVFSGLAGITTAAHIHCCLPSPFLAGVNVGVATLVPAFPGFPLGVTSGTDNFLLHLDSAAAYNPAFVTLQGSLANAETAFIGGLTSGRTYLNIHTNLFPGGEIRGFAAVPEPMTATLLVLGLAAAGFVSRRRRRI
jgi:hypothetical protein